MVLAKKRVSVSADWFTLEEYCCLSFFVPYISCSISLVLWDIAHTEEVRWESKGEISMIFAVTVRFIFAVAVTSKYNSLAFKLLYS